MCKVRDEIEFVVNKDNIDRIIVYENKRSIRVVVDLHRLKKWETRILLTNIINIVSEPIELVVIHGFNHGTVLRDYVREELRNKKIQRWSTCGNNAGRTKLYIA